MTPGGALLVGVLAGVLSTFGYAYGSPFMEDYFKVYDTCGVHNLHGIPSLLGGLSSAMFVAIDNDAAFLHNEGIPQPVRQILAVVTTLALAIVSGYITGIVMKLTTLGEIVTMDEYNDAMWWVGGYMELLPQHELDLSGKSKTSVSPIIIQEATDVFAS